MTTSEISSETVLLGFLVVICAGLSTGIGAAVVYFPKLVNLASRRVLASALGISAGVMTYVSFVEIFVKSVDSFDEHLLDTYEDDDERSGMANLYATLAFFGGVVLNAIIDLLVRKLSGEHAHGNPILDNGNEVKHSVLEDEGDDNNSVEDIIVPHCIGCSPDPVGELREWRDQAQREVDEQKGITTLSPEEESESSAEQLELQKSQQSSIIEDMTENKDIEKMEEVHEKRKLVKMGLQTAIAIALHNFPEGLATFVAFIKEPAIGIALAVAIAIHNIPEGFCVSLPVYYSSGNRTKAFLWGTFSGVTEPIGALIGWLFFLNGLNLALYGCLFGVVGGMMVMISFRELLPTAFRYDPRDTVVTNSLVAGMFVMSLSLVLFRVA